MRAFSAASNQKTTESSQAVRHGAWEVGQYRMSQCKVSPCHEPGVLSPPFALTAWNVGDDGWGGSRFTGRGQCQEVGTMSFPSKGKVSLCESVAILSAPASSLS